MKNLGVKIVIAAIIVALIFISNLALVLIDKAAFLLTF